MRLLIDECVDRRLASELKGHFVRTVPKMGWAAFKNGELLSRAAGEFDVFITVDRNLSYQQSLRKHDIAVLVLKAKTNRLTDLKPLVPRILKVLRHLKKHRATLLG